MQYRINPRNGDRISALGFGCLRINRDDIVSFDKSDKVIKATLDAGINYFDTAWAYTGNEFMLGHALNQFTDRDKIYIATKAPPPEWARGCL